MVKCVYDIMFFLPKCLVALTFYHRDLMMSIFYTLHIMIYP